ncbi:hypothetical protein [Cohnella candidum]|uniref:Uncharacterized protein n=1 Tax=Cohnella candidum TaxID=2674991 RepID=A0A3G3JU32_9BACL|nr:hypothetical protein [Cohnella candidum]AYQ71743.1 hypothetical protein EAV92_03640 [Cohnella candidum]
MASKRSYTVPVLLLIITGLAILLMLIYSKLLFTQQKEYTDAGKRLAERYNYALIFADRLGTGADLLLKDGSVADRLKAKKLLGEASMAGGETVGILAEASSRSTGQSFEEAFKPVSEAMTRIMSEQAGNVYGVSEHEGALTAEEKELLTAVRDGASKMKEQLLVFRPPTVDSGYRTMNAGGEWIAQAVAAGQTLIDTAAKVK